MGPPIRPSPMKPICVAISIILSELRLGLSC